MNGYFNFDDFGNLNALGQEGGVHDWASFLRYLTSSHADPTGRPIATLSFLIDGNDWPAWARSFKQTNLLLHLLNGTLLVWTLLKLSRVSHSEEIAQRAALIGGAIWLLHPLLVSTTLYVVQREAMLPVTFGLAGILLWLHGRSSMASSQTRGTVWMLVGLWGGTFLGTLSKANGMLLPLLVLVLEGTVLRRACGGAPESSSLVRSRRYVLGIPLAAMALIIVSLVPDAVNGAPNIRPWTVGQRLLTEPRVLIEYLRLLWLPRSLSSGLFNDQIHASTSLFEPLTTVFSLLALMALFAAGLLLRKRRPAWALAILFFLAGHVLESSFIPLELYFEHRNYLPALFLFWPLALWLADDRSQGRTKAFASIAIIVFLALLTHARASLWGAPLKQAVVWAKINPQSPRAQTNGAMFLLTQGRVQEAHDLLTQAATRFPNEAQVISLLASTECRSHHLGKETKTRLLEAFRLDPHGTRLPFNWIEASLKDASRHSCQGLDLAFLDEAVASLSRNDRASTPGGQQDLAYLHAIIALANDNGDVALASFDAGLDDLAQPATALKQAALLGTYGYPELGLRHLAYYQTVHQPRQFHLNMPAIHAWLLERQSYWKNEFDELSIALRKDAANRQAGMSRAPAR
ncbi:tetratricopeptide repeat protein [Frateuria sp. STR12]|uniref:tetratricopeptide repeat protein n=1 Tax=Frateuria hangzhouensis TaxID=2995589 RepID=UPI002260ED0F|nr:tetratricopeptide repeat protein [Frateuria sp. STR12]MCX7513735.1 tetratricopeptide repeat protein [Frateuria sp. STR12]